MSQKTIDNTVEIINNLSEKEAKQKLIDLLVDGYVVMPWPYSQEFMDEEWFDDEAVLADADAFGSSAYFIPIYKII